MYLTHYDFVFNYCFQLFEYTIIFFVYFYVLYNCIFLLRISEILIFLL